MHEVNQLLGYWSENPPTHVMLKSLFQIKKRPGLSNPVTQNPRLDDTTNSDVGRMLGAGMASTRGKKKNGR